MCSAKPPVLPGSPDSEAPGSGDKVAGSKVKGSGRVTLRDLARQLGVSVATVSNAYNRPDQLSTELRERVLQAAHELGYHGPDPLARSLRRGRTGVIGVVYDAPLDYAFADPAAALFLGRVAHTVQREDLNLLLLASPSDVHPDALPVRTASVDGFIVYCAAEESPLLGAVLERRLPTVLVDQLPAPTAVQVGIDNAVGAEAAARHLGALGHHHVGILSLELSPERRGGPVSVERKTESSYHTTAERLRGYRKGLPSARFYATETRQNSLPEGEKWALALLREQPLITALLCMSDVLAQGALSAARQLGRQVPHDLSIIGYDDLPSSAALHLTTVWQPTAEKGDQAGTAMLRLLAGEHAGDVRLPTRLIVRGTTAPIAPQD